MSILEERSGVYSLLGFGPEVRLLFSTKSFTRVNRSEFLSAISVSPNSFKTVKQVHGSGIKRVVSVGEVTSNIEADGLLTDQNEVALGIFTADCLPVFFYSKAAQVIGLAHAGWRGLKAGILSKMVASMADFYRTKSSEIKVGVGPFNRKCCYEVGREFLDLFPKDYFVPKNQSKGHVDLGEFARRELTSSGILESNIFDSDICTVCHNDRFFSARKDQGDERILSVIGFSLAKPVQN